VAVAATAVIAIVVARVLAAGIASGVAPAFPGLGIRLAEAEDQCKRRGEHTREQSISKHFTDSFKGT
jgi:hypothetical protein